jgi:hypothetical protein
MNPGDGIRGTLGFGVPGVEIYLPISSDLTLGFWCPTILAVLAAEHGALQRSALPSLGGTDELLNAVGGSGPMRLGAENVKYHNSLQAAGAERFVFSQHKNFDLLQEMLKANPALRAGPRIEIVGGSRSRRQAKQQKA